MLNKFMVKEHVRNALKEDIGFIDITTDTLVEDKNLRLNLIAKADGIICGLEVFEIVFKELSEDFKIKFYFKDGDTIKKGDKVAEVEGLASTILIGERTALNYIQRMSGIATLTNKYQKVLDKYGVKITDTRKTTPCFRLFEKHSVMVGGAIPHRFNLSDCVMIKDNHISYAGSITKAVEKIRACISHTHKIEVECETLDQVKEAISCKADIIMLDNMSNDMMAEAVKIIDKQAIVEASGNVTYERLEEIAKTGVDIISTSAIVAGAETLDLSLKA